MPVASLRTSPTGQELAWMFAIADSMPQIVWSALPDGNHDYFNRRFYEFTGQAVEESRGNGWQAAFHPEDRPECTRRWNESLKNGEPYEVEYRLRDTSGSYRWMLGRGLPLRGPDGVIRRWVGTCTDIDDLRQMRAREEVVNQELNHRIKNIFSVMGGLVRLEARDYPEAAAFADSISARIDALGRAHSISVGARDRPESRTLCDILTTVLAPYETLAQVTVDCPPDLEVTEKAMLPFSLALHEIATNAAKHGALAKRSRLSVAVKRLANGNVELCWREENPDAEEALRSTGLGQSFGSKLLKLTLESQLGAVIKRTADSGELMKTITFPAHNFLTKK